MPSFARLWLLFLAWGGGKRIEGRKEEREGRKGRREKRKEETTVRAIKIPFA